MLSLQILSKVIQTKDISIIEDNFLTKDYFVGYEEEYDFIINHNKEYGQIPDKETFLSKFKDRFIDGLPQVEESDEYLVKGIREEYTYRKSVPILEKSAELLKDNSYDAVEYLMNSLKAIQVDYGLKGKDIISEASDRFDEYKDRKDNKDKWHITTGFKELDEQIGGLQRGEELVVLFARINQGKSWILEKMSTHAWQLGYNVGYISPEMSATNVGFRFDTLFKHYSNKGLTWSKEDEINEEEYKKYIDELKEHKNKFIVSTPLDFGNKITVSKIRKWAEQYNLEYVAIDGIKYLYDERYKRGDNTTTSLTNISEDLMSLSMELRIPIIVVIQANRGGVESPELDTIRDSDGPGQLASKVLSIRQLTNNVLEIGIKKNRFGFVGGKLKYSWDINTGEFDYLVSQDDSTTKEQKEKSIEDLRSKFNDSKEDLF